MCVLNGIPQINIIWQTPKPVLYNSLVHSLISINQLLESVYLCPKVIPLSGAYCISKIFEHWKRNFHPTKLNKVSKKLCSHSSWTTKEQREKMLNLSWKLLNQIEFYIQSFTCCVINYILEWIFWISLKIFHFKHTMNYVPTLSFRFSLQNEYHNWK